MRSATRLTLKGGGALALIALGLAACASLPSGVRLANLTPAEKMMWSTYVVATRKGLATGFVVLRRDPQAPGGRVPVVVTSAHLLETAPQGPFYLGLRLPDQAGNLQVAVLELKPTPSRLTAYVRHPRYDVAALELRMPPEVAKLLWLPSFLEEKALGRLADRPRAGEGVCVLGFPDVYPGTAGAFPVLRGGTVASYSAGGPDGPPRFLIHTDVYPGDSGGPVFAARGRGRPRLVGMVTRSVGPNPHAAVPLAIAVDARTIRETLQLLVEREAEGQPRLTQPAGSRPRVETGTLVRRPPRDGPLGPPQARLLPLTPCVPLRSISAATTDDGTRSFSGIGRP